MKNASEWLEDGLSPRSANLRASVDYMAAVNGFMRGQPHVGPQMGNLTDNELLQMDAARVAGIEPETFVQTLIATRREKMKLSNVRRFLSDAFPDSRPGSNRPLERSRA